VRITLLALGSLGDVVPCIALGRGLVERGHRVRLASHVNFAGLAAGSGLDFTPVAVDVQALLQQAGPKMSSIFKQFFSLAREFATGFSASELGEADVVLNQLPGGLYGWDIAEKSGIPMIELAYLPLAPTAAFPMISFPHFLSKLPGYNRLTYRIAQQLVWQIFRGAVNTWRRDTLGLPPQSRVGNFGALGTQRVPYLMGLSPELVPPPEDWGRYVHVTGYWYPQEAEWRPAAEFVHFIENGPAPVFVGFGSMPVKDPARTTAMVLEAARLSGQRCVLHAGWAGLGAETVRGPVYSIDYAPYEWLFPRMSALVIHGGAGAVHFAARSGVPALVTPFGFDQGGWGERFATLGVGPKPAAFGSLSAARLAREIRRMAQDAQMRSRAAALGTRVRAERGVAAAIEKIEAHFGRKREVV
jgi:sterol 3beta-glucosyltransferase